MLRNGRIPTDNASVEYESSCVKFDTKSKIWKEVHRMNEARSLSACAVYEGKLVVSGGCNNNGRSLNTVEAYDHVADEWSYFPNMINRRGKHNSVAIKNKLFVVASWRTSEVFDSRCNKFVLLKPPPAVYKYVLDGLVEVITVGSKLVVFGNECDIVVYYDAENDTWSEESCGITKNINHYSCAKIPQL